MLFTELSKIVPDLTSNSRMRHVQTQSQCKDYRTSSVQHKLDSVFSIPLELFCAVQNTHVSIYA